MCFVHAYVAEDLADLAFVGQLDDLQLPTVLDHAVLHDGRLPVQSEAAHLYATSMCVRVNSRVTLAAVCLVTRTGPVAGRPECLRDACECSRLLLSRRPPGIAVWMRFILAAVDTPVKYMVFSSCMGTCEKHTTTDNN